MFAPANHHRWSFGGNRLQIKAETHLLADVHANFQATSSIGEKTSGSLKSLVGKQELLLNLLKDEQTRLMVWLFPLDFESKHLFLSKQHSLTPTDVSSIFTQIIFYSRAVSGCFNSVRQDSLGRGSCPGRTPHAEISFCQDAQRCAVATTEFPHESHQHSRRFGDSAWIEFAQRRVFSTYGWYSCFL